MAAHCSCAAWYKSKRVIYSLVSMRPWTCVEGTSGATHIRGISNVRHLSDSPASSAGPAGRYHQQLHLGHGPLALRHGIQLSSERLYVDMKRSRWQASQMQDMKGSAPTHVPADRRA
jgi:hypothetical protein